MIYYINRWIKINKIDEFINKANDKIDEKFNEFCNKILKTKEMKEELIESNTEFDENYKMKKSCNINDLYVGNIENMDYGKANCWFELWSTKSKYDCK